ncbi:LPXTG cell wall anchor domain-containing protein [Streptococcus caprae]
MKNNKKALLAALAVLLGGTLTTPIYTLNSHLLTAYAADDTTPPEEDEEIPSAEEQELLLSFESAMDDLENALNDNDTELVEIYLENAVEAQGYATNGSKSIGAKKQLAALNARFEALKARANGSSDNTTTVAPTTTTTATTTESTTVAPTTTTTATTTESTTVASTTTTTTTTTASNKREISKPAIGDEEGYILVQAPEYATRLTIKFVDNNNQTRSVVAYKDASGQWVTSGDVVTDDVMIVSVDGKVIVAINGDIIKADSDFTAYAEDEFGNKSDLSEVTIVVEDNSGTTTTTSNGNKETKPLAQDGPRGVVAKKTLPSTGDSDATTGLFAGLIALTAGLAGAFGFKKREE